MGDSPLRLLRRHSASFLVLVLSVLGFATGAGAGAGPTLTVASDKPTYVVGETIILTVTGDSGGVADEAIFGSLRYEAALTSTVTSSQTTHTSGAVPWITGILSVGDGSADVFNQISPTATPLTVQQLQIATATLIADAPGTVHVTWASSAGVELDFFGIVVGTQATFSIVPAPGGCPIPSAAVSQYMSVTGPTILDNLSSDLRICHNQCEELKRGCERVSKTAVRCVLASANAEEGSAVRNCNTLSGSSQKACKDSAKANMKSVFEFVRSDRDNNARPLCASQFESCLSSCQSEN